MVILQIVGYLFLFIASISSSVSMNFQKLAQYEIFYHDPRKRLRKRQTPIKTSVFCRPLFIIAILLSAGASSLDFMALTWLPPSTVGVFGSSSIIINLLVTRVILFEVPTKKEWVAITYVILGCLLAISVTPDHGSGMPVPQLLDRTISYVYIVLNWTVFLLFSMVLEKNILPAAIQRVGYPFIGGALGAQNVCMGKYIAYAFSNTIDGQLTVRLDTLLATILLCIGSVILHIYWLNKGLEKHDAYYCIIIYQTAWFMFTTLSGVFVYDDMSILTTPQQIMFIIGLLTAVYGVKRISVLHEKTPEGPETKVEESVDFIDTEPFKQSVN